MRWLWLTLAMGCKPASLACDTCDSEPGLDSVDSPVDSPIDTEDSPETGDTTETADTEDTTETADTSDDTAETDDTGTVEFAITYKWWWNDRIDIEIVGSDATGFRFGIAETGPDNEYPNGYDLNNSGSISSGEGAGSALMGWYGEDCLNGTASYDYCHAFDSLNVSLDVVETLGEVEEGATTLFDENLAEWNTGDNPPRPNGVDEGDPRLTYFLELEFDDNSTECYVWGEDPSYYASFRCSVIDL